jgi:DNA repair protein RecN (Recombination protein N)
MLNRLRVRNLALVEDAKIAFSRGLNVVTGETGAGKSILIGALGLLLGGRGDASSVRAGAAQCTVEAVFSLEGAAARAVDAALEAAGLEPCEGGELIVRRTVKASGGGGAAVNDAPVTLGLLKQLGRVLVDLHGPHDHQSLLSPAAQLALLDAYAHSGPELAAYREVFGKRRALLESLEELSAEVPDLEGQIDLLEYRVKDIESVSPEAGEEESVRREQAAVGNAARILELSQQAAWGISEDEASALQALGPVRRALEELEKVWPEAEGWAGELKGHADALAALSAEIQRAASHVEADGGRLEWLDGRLAAYERLKRKYGPELEDVLGVLEESKRRLAALRSRGERREAAERELQGVEKELRRAGGALRAKRRAAAARLEKAVEGELRPLGFAQCRFSVRLAEAEEPQTDGLDRVEFGFSANPGEPERALRAIASSGEISRVMLGIKVVLASVDEIPLLVFDEIDANVGGETAHAVGRKLAEAGKTRQVVAITHLAPVAACGGTHFVVRKAVEDGRTRTFVAEVSGAEREAEISRMLGGDDGSGVVLRHAQELLKGARRGK